ncbi:syndecan-2-like [Xyrichtys novacula]|uniref:Syndecan-2-like n=1 Tax=Xyrichtys novacula TaxID=13765 RepID=A0AAV1GV44_XYRNO|nr:syndecan-2-like [Xyrichtys novacula]
MRTCLSVVLVSVVVLNSWISASAEDLEGPGTDLEGPGTDLESSGSGSGDWSEQDEDEDFWEVWTSENTEEDSKSPPSHVCPSCSQLWRTQQCLVTPLLLSLQEPSGTFDEQQWPSRDSYVILANRKTFLENKEVLDGVIAGGVTGVILAATVAAILIYKWQKEDADCHRRSRVPSEEDDRRRCRDEI